MRTRKMRLMSFVLALAMMLAIAPVSAFAASAVVFPTGMPVEKLHFDSEGKPIFPEGEGQISSNNYYYKSPSEKQWTAKEDHSSVTIHQGYSFNGKDEPKIMVPVTVNGIIEGGTYGWSVSVQSIGALTGGVFQNVVGNDGSVYGGIFLNTFNNKANGTVYGGVFASDPSLKNTAGGTINDIYTLTADGCQIYSADSYKYYEQSNDKNTSVLNKAWVVGEQKVVLTTSSPAFDHWEINGVAVDNSNSAVTLDDEGNATLTYTMPGNGNVTITPVVKPVKFHIGANGKPEYTNANGKVREYFGNLELDGWRLDTATEPYTLYVAQGFNVDLEQHKVDWTIRNNGTVENGITLGFVLNRENEDGTYGKVKNIIHKTNVNFHDDTLIETWVTLKNATACDGAITGYFGVIGQQTITVKPSVSKDHFAGWTYSGEMSDAVAEQLEEQKNQYEITLELDGDKADTIALIAKSDVDTFGITMLDGKASVTSAAPGETVTLSIDDSEIPEGMSFDHWVISPEVEPNEGYKLTDRTMNFTMPAQELTIYASLRTDSDDGTDAMTIVAGVAIGAGAAVLTYHIGTELYAKQVLGDGVAVPKTRADVALKAWELAGKPAVELNGEPLSETAQAEKWAVESGLMQNVDGSFNGAKKMNKLKALRVLDSAKKMNAQ